MNEAFNLKLDICQHKDPLIAGLCWNDILQRYSQCVLTRPNDKLVAISGIAKSFSELGRSEDYFAGLWRRLILSLLLWSRTNRLRSCITKADEYRAPSWSWASVDGSIRLGKPMYNDPMTSTLIDVKAENVTPDRFGQVISGSITIAGSLKLFSFKSKEIVDSADRCIMRCEDMYLQDKFYKFGVRGFGHALLDQDFSTLKDVSRLHFLPLILDKWRTEGLLLSPTGKAKGHFQRSGVLQISHSKLGIWHPCESDCLEYESFNGSLYTVTII
ncbi:uncharacterized protein LY89DRAFT_666539 [Mollisia scopiformis]|uniref:Uncharacterized protein n=1 Tax=Mollisia scopiformis TaxID=149040 RepID=A0A194XHI6_MOLSC|nr:uncharacterized protein LY89DRAFT_666539 [Mollisia scopiformis]KUJ19675.1 hypothetical protein LY89DRAFT_666539 [Mollisia scopiformis]